MENKKKFGLVGGAATTLGALLSGGCPQPAANSPPQISLFEPNGTIIRTTESEAIAREYGWDQAIILPINREDIQRNNERFIVEASDIDGPKPLTGNFYPYDGTVRVSIGSGQNLENRLTWNVAILGENIPRGTYPLLVGEVRDGYHKRTVGVLGAISRGQSFEPGTEPPYIIGDGVCSPGEPASSPDCQQVTPPVFTPGNGLCESALGETWRNSPDCQIDESAWVGTGVQLYDGNNKINPTDDPGFKYTMPVASSRKLNARFTIPKDVDNARIARNEPLTFGVFTRGYNEYSPSYDPINNPDCFFEANVGQPSLISEEGGIRTYKVDFDAVHSGCEAIGLGYEGQRREAFEGNVVVMGRVYTDREEFQAVE